jgi:biotin carboxylase
VTFGFLPAAARLGVDVIIVTDQPGAHQRACTGGRPGPGCAADAAARRANAAPAGIVGCDVWDARSLIARVAALPMPRAVFSNSDHLQAQTALAATYFGLPGKDWRSSLRAKDKALMRRRLAETGREQVAVAEITAATEHPLHHLPYPVVLKPAEGVASENVVLVREPAELAGRCAEIFSRRPGERLIAEEYLPGALRTLETLSDGMATWVLGGFRTRLSAPPFFVEERLSWDADVPETEAKHVLSALEDLGVSFGACHTEFVSTAACGARLVEVNDRLIGDHCDFLLADLLGVDLFELVLRVHLGEPLPAGPAPVPLPARMHAMADYVVAARSGVLAASPAAGPQPGAEPGVLLGYQPLHDAGGKVTVTHTNRDYLGVISAIGPDPGAVERSVAGLRARGGWEITAEPCP